MKEKVNETSHGPSKPAHSTSGIKRKLGMAPQVVAVKLQSDVQTKASSGFNMRKGVMGEAISRKDGRIGDRYFQATGFL